MGDVKFKIDKVRLNSFYHYTRYNGESPILDSAGNPDSGWGLYSHLATEIEQTAWINAVTEYNNAHGIIVPSVKIKNNIEKFRNKFTVDDEKVYPDRQSYILPALDVAISFIVSDDACSDDFLDKLMAATGGVIPTKEAIAKHAIEAAKNNIELDFHILLDSYKNLGVTAFIYPLCDYLESFVDLICTNVDAIYNEYTRLHSDPIYLFRKWTSDITLTPEQKEEYKRCFKSAISALSSNVREIVLKIITIDLVKKMTDLLQSVKTLGSSVWESLISQFNAIKETVTETEFDNKDKFLSILNTVLYALGGLIGSMLAARCVKNKEIDAAIESLCNTDNVADEQELIEKTNNEIEEYRTEIGSNTIIYRYAADGKEGYSFNKNQTDSLESISESYFPTTDDPDINELIELCKVSMCKTEDPTDTSEWFNMFDYSEMIIIEFDRRLNFIISATVNQIVNLNDIIAYIKNVPVKSRSKFIVTEIGKTYIIGNYIFDSDQDKILSEFLGSASESNGAEIANNIQSLINEKVKEYSDNEYDRIIQKYQKFTYSKDFIRDYISFYRFPELAQFTREYAAGNSAAISSDKFIELYEDAAQKILDDYYNDVKKTCKKKNLKKYVNKGKIPTLKSILDKKSDNCISKILNLHKSNPGNMKYCSLGRITDFMLYSHYAEFLYGDKFEYDETNPYIKALSDKITDFLAVRSRIELNKDNLGALIDSFNEICRSTIDVCWPFDDKDYYTKLTELFKYDNYTDTEVISEGTVGDSISLYKRVLNYLKSITKFTRAEDYTIDLENTGDFNKLLEEQDKQEDKKVNKEEVRFERNLKKIAYRFAGLRKIELSLTNTEISEYANNSVVQDFEKLRLRIGDSIYEYSDSVQYQVTDKLYQARSILGPYIQMMKQITANEEAELKKIYESALSFYLANKDSVDSCEDIFKLAEINWPGSSIIYKDDNPCDYYLFRYNTPICPGSMADLYEAESILENLPETTGDELYDMSASPATKYGIDNILYWLKYCGIATLVNTMIPLYWATGLNIGAPIPLPIIYLPIIPICIGPLVIVVGIGICGICPLPMILFANTGTDKASILIPINLAVEEIKKLVQRIPSLQKPAIQGIVNPLISSLDNEINSSITEIEKINYQIEEINAVRTDPATKFYIDDILSRDTTTNIALSGKESEIKNPTLNKTKYKISDKQSDLYVSAIKNISEYEYSNLDKDGDISKLGDTLQKSYAKLKQDLSKI